MTRQSSELAWDITDWDITADLSEANFRYNIGETFLNNGLVVPASIICRPDQEHELVKSFPPSWDNNDGSHIAKIVTPYGDMKLKVLPLERVTITRAVR